MIILVTKNQSFTPSLEDAYSKKSQRGGGGAGEGVGLRMDPINEVPK